MNNLIRASFYKISHSFLPLFLLAYTVFCLWFALFADVGRFVDVVTSEGLRIGFFPAGSMTLASPEERAVSTAQSVNLLVWIGLIVVLASVFRKNKDGQDFRTAVAHGAGRARYELSEFFGQSLFFQGWYAALNLFSFLAAGALFGDVSGDYLLLTASYWVQNALLLQCLIASGRTVSILCKSEIAGTVFLFLETVISLIAAASNTAASPSPMLRFLLCATPMPYWLKLGACQTDLSGILGLTLATVFAAEGIVFLYRMRCEIK